VDWLSIEFDSNAVLKSMSKGAASTTASSRIKQLLAMAEEDAEFNWGGFILDKATKQDKAYTVVTAYGCNDDVNDLYLILKRIVGRCKPSPQVSCASVVL
jgi:hypothetical protein